jgi:arylsulfatase A-like enzyme
VKRYLVMSLMVLLVFCLGYFLGGRRSNEQPVELSQRAEPGQGAQAAGSKTAEPAQEGPPNILIILWDTVRADRLGTYGNPRNTTPFIDRFSKQAAVFERAISPAMWTVPAHGSLFTGLAVAEHGATVSHRQLDKRFETMAERFGVNGYDTYAFSANPNLNPRSIGLVQGFDTVELSWSKDYRNASAQITAKKLIEGDISTEISPGRRSSTNRDEVFFNAAPVARRAFRRWLKNRGSEKPFLAYINMMEAHKPRVPLLKTREEVIGDQDIIEMGLKTSITEIEQIKYMVGLHEYSEEELEAILAVYDSSLRELDAATHGISEDLRAVGSLENTIVVLVSDHGEALGEHGLFAHKYGLYDELVRVPLIIRYPRLIAPRRYYHPVTTADLYPTLLDLTGIQRPDGLDNPSLLADVGPEAVYSEIASTNAFKYIKLKQKYPDVEIEPFLRTARMIERDGYKFIAYEDGSHELYRLAEDPKELNDLSGEEPERSRAMRDKLLEWFESHNRRKQAVAVDEVIRPSGGDEKLLQLLGYVE